MLWNECLVTAVAGLQEITWLHAVAIPMLAKNILAPSFSVKEPTSTAVISSASPHCTNSVCICLHTRFAVTFFLSTLSTYVLWNWGLVGAVDCVEEVTFQQALGILVLGKLVCGVFRSSISNGNLVF